MRRRTREILVWLILLVVFLWLIFYIVSSFFLSGIKDVVDGGSVVAVKNFFLSEISMTIGFSILGVLALALIIDRIVEKNKRG